MTISELHHHLEELAAERAAASQAGLAHRLYLDDLEHEIAQTRAAFVGVAVAEIAILRADLSGPLAG